MKSEWKLWNIRLNCLTKDEVLSKVNMWLSHKSRHKWIATVNPEFIMKAKEDKEFRKLLKKTDLNVIDGIGLVWAKEIEDRFKKSKLIGGFKTGMEVLKGQHKGKIVAGADLMDDLCRLAQEKGYNVFFLGGWDKRALKTANYFKKKYQGLKVAGCYGGDAANDLADDDKLSKLMEQHIDILFVAYGMRRQEDWIYRNLEELDVGVAMGVGRSFDYYSGELVRAPEGVRRMGLEWLYSLIKEPKRIERQAVLPKFIWKVIKK